MEITGSITSVSPLSLARGTIFDFAFNLSIPLPDSLLHTKRFLSGRILVYDLYESTDCGTGIFYLLCLSICRIRHTNGT